MNYKAIRDESFRTERKRRHRLRMSRNRQLVMDKIAAEDLKLEYYLTDQDVMDGNIEHKMLTSKKFWINPVSKSDYIQEMCSHKELQRLVPANKVF